MTINVYLYAGESNPATVILDTNPRTTLFTFLSVWAININNVIYSTGIM